MEQKWIDKLRNFETTPPAGMWDRLESALDGEAPGYAQKLRSFEAAPPAAAWDRIAAQLDGAAGAESEVPVVTLRKRRSFAPYVAAASLIGVLLVAATLLFDRPGDRPGVVNVAKNETTKPAAPTPAATENNPVATQPAPSNITAKEPAPDAGADVAVAPVRNHQNAATATALAPDGRADRSPALAARTALASARPVDDDRYLVRAYNNGQVVRFSKKVSPVVDCAENASGFTQSLCKVSIGAVQDKMATTVSTDFGGLIERLQDLEKASR